MNIIEVTNLSYSYDGKNPALSGVSFSVTEGSYVALIGHNGSGKSTLAKVLAGLNSGFDGSVKIFGLDLDAKNISSIRNKMGLVFQNPDNQFVGSSVRDDIAFGLENRQVPSNEMDAIIEQYSKEVGMHDFLDSAPENLSGGQKQRIAIAGVLAMKPNLIIYDEATSMLDPVGKKDILDLTFRLRKENPSLTVLSITHDVEEAYHADKVLVLNEGKLMLSGTPDEVFSHEEELNKIRLGCPFYISLRNELERQGIKIPSSVHNEKELEDFLCR
ncbi:MAG: energy-coupling factor transporter ATPase [Bacilli bacterium]|jgi:energy-coupling factor transport system ATP-binding protein|nr:energy-coupling factor transporter ATPase [Bacilli bacterium]MCH4210764.1 energy-coupling factor transporter ATPase [Bacilli bacterium]MCH4277962.1 energy-coupling factor transporter ATPase [Bacilli bacterium]MCI2055357.1 energy-coupling factor transporter ATPase [Bacilli bacterium]